MSEFVAAELAAIATCSTRLEILRFLGSGSQSVGDITTSLGLSYQLVSNHLRTLRDAELVQAHRDGKQVFYSLSPHCQSRDDGIEATWTFLTTSGCKLVLVVPVSVLDAT